MKATEYSEKALRTEAPVDPIKTRIQDESLIRLVHACLGLGSDLEELSQATNPAHCQEEVGDMFWFLNLGYAGIGRIMPDSEAQPFPGVGVETTGACGTMRTLVAELQDVVKGRMFYGKTTWNGLDFETNVACILGALFDVLEDYCIIVLDKTVAEVQAANIAKLSARFPDKFTEAKALERDVAAEYDAMAR